MTPRRLAAVTHRAARAPSGPGPGPRSAVGGDLHTDPPVSPGRILLRHRATVPLLLGVVAALGALAGYDDGRLLAPVDRPVTRALVELRSPEVSSVMEAATAFGGIPGIAAGLGVAVLLLWRRCRTLAAALVAASVARPFAEEVVKHLVDRPRPRLDPLVVGHGPSFPSGHVLGAVALWGLLPPIVATFTNRRALWWTSVVVSGAVVAVVAVSRVYLGAHWLTDVVASLLLGACYLLVVEDLWVRRHRRRGCRPARSP